MYLKKMLWKISSVIGHHGVYWLYVSKCKFSILRFRWYWWHTAIAEATRRWLIFGEQHDAVMLLALWRLKTNVCTNTQVNQGRNVTHPRYWAPVRRIYRWLVGFSHNRPVMRKACPCHDVFTDINIDSSLVDYIVACVINPFIWSLAWLAGI